MCKLLKKPIMNEGLWVLIIFFMALGLYLLNNTHEQVYFDEVLSLLAADTPTAGDTLTQITTSGSEANPPLYYLLLRLVRILCGKSLFVSRGLSAFWAAMLLVVFFLTIKKLFNLQSAIYASILLLLNPIICAFAQEIRAYTMATFLVWINIITFYLALQSGKKKYWWLYTISGITGVFTHYYFLFTYFINFVLFLIQLRRKSENTVNVKELYIPGLICTGISLATFVCWLPVFFRHSRETAAVSWFEQPSMMTPLKIISYFFTSKFTLDINPFFSPGFFTGIFLIVVCFGIYTFFKYKKSILPVCMLITAFLVPLFMTLLYSMLASSVINFRYYILFFPFLAGLAGIGFARIPHSALRIILFILFNVLLLPVTVQIYTQNFNGPAEDTAQYLQENLSENELILTGDAHAFLTQYYYQHGRAGIFYFSDIQLPVCYGINAVPGRFIIRNAITPYLEQTDSFWLVLTPWSSWMEKYFEGNFPSFRIDTTFPEKIFEYPRSWFKNKVLHFRRIDNL